MEKNSKENIHSIKSFYILQKIISLLWKNKILHLFALNKKLQNKFSISKEDYLKLRLRYKKLDQNGRGKEYSIYTDELIFEGEYLDGKRNGEGKEYYPNLNIKFEGKYLKGEKISGKKYDIQGNIILVLENGKGKECYDNGQIQFEGEYFNGKRWNGKAYNYQGKEEFVLKYGKGVGKEYYLIL